MTDAPLSVNSIVLNGMLGHLGFMKPVFTLFAAGMALVACGPLSLYYRPGVSVTRMQNDQISCEVGALKDAPVANELRQRPPIFIPGRQICGTGGCYTNRGYWVSGGSYTVDLNSDLRSRVETQCMSRKGYQPIDVPLCTGAVKASFPPGQTQVLPKLTQSTCAVRYDDGSWQIVNPISSKSKG
jgi:hypothetical protein